jgi:hypothetical protein
MRARAKASRFERIRGSAIVLGIAAFLSGLGTFAAAAVGNRPSTARPRLEVRPAKLAPAVQISPGDRIERIAVLRYHGAPRFKGVFLTTTFPRDSRLAADKKSGLRLSIDRCSTSWLKRQGRSSYGCRGKRWIVLGPAGLDRQRRLKHLSLRAEREDHLRLILTFPASADDSFQGQVTRLVYTFRGVG